MGKFSPHFFVQHSSFFLSVINTKIYLFKYSHTVINNQMFFLIIFTFSTTHQDFRNSSCFFLRFHVKFYSRAFFNNHWRYQPKKL